VPQGRADIALHGSPPTGGEWNEVIRSVPTAALGAMPSQMAFISDGHHLEWPRPSTPGVTAVRGRATASVRRRTSPGSNDSGPTSVNRASPRCLFLLLDHTAIWSAAATG